MDGKSATQRYREAHREKYLETNLKYREQKPDFMREWAYQTKYGISIEEYNILLNSQNGCCAICDRPERTKIKKTGKCRKLAVDHNHETGKVRGLLCHYCNTGIGKFEENVELLTRAIKYINDNSEFYSRSRRNLENYDESGLK